MRPQPVGAALPGTYNARGRFEPVAHDRTEAHESEAASDADAANDTDAANDAEAANDGEAKGEADEHRDPYALTPEQEQTVADLRARDREVRTHEQAHQAAGGGRAGAASYTYQSGPDGNRYAVGGEVPIRMPSASEPNQRAQEARVVRRAALAPAEPSGADRAVASSASQIEVEARAEAAEMEREAAEAARTEAAERAQARAEESGEESRAEESGEESRVAESQADHSAEHTAPEPEPSA